MNAKQILEKVKQFFREVVAEGKKVSWSSKQEFIGATIVVIFAILVLSMFIGLVDFVLSRLFGLIM
ncbi:MAG: preprotein translocase subunit SecE [bacterium]|jgi:preprotein translocase subunit SecE|nr:preprotein translocase subunit SecE [bacterium]